MGGVQPDMVRVADLGELERRGRMVVKKGGKQIALFHRQGKVVACNNRCPHEGYPLAEGSLAEAGDACVLTCNWHNWKFDLEDGRNLTGGDRLRTYPVAVADGGIWLDLADPPPETVQAHALANLRDAFPRHEYDRMARELARLARAGGDPLDALRAAIGWTYERFEYGGTHAFAATADWLALADEVAWDRPSRLAAIVECIGHLAWDSRREPAVPFAESVAPYRPEALVAAIEREDEAAAAAQVRGAYAEGLDFPALERPLAEAALAHYADFGHAAIYVFKTGALIDRLGGAVALPLTLWLVRSLVNVFREDLIPEFRAYGDALAGWTGTGTRRVAAADFAGAPVRKALRLASGASGDIPALYDALMGAAAWNLLHFDMDYQDRTSGPVSQNVGWLDFTHAVTFGNAVRHLCRRHPALWPQGLLQMACFAGRNAGFVDAALAETPWRVAEPAAWLDATRRDVFDHGRFEYIVSAHLVKTVCAVHDEVQAAPAAPWAGTLVAGLNRFLNSPLKRKHTLRTAQQSLAFVAAEG